MWGLATVYNIVFSLEARFDGSGRWSLPSVVDEETVTISLCSLYLRQGRQGTKCPSLSRCSVLLGRLTLGRDAREPELWVVIVSTVVMPRPTRAGAASMLIQKEIHERMTMSRLGMYIWIR